MARGWDGECARLPLEEKLLEPGEKTGERGQDESVQGRDYPGAEGVVGGVAVGLGTDVGQEAGKGLGRKGDWVQHVSYLS